MTIEELKAQVHESLMNVFQEIEDALDESDPSDKLLDGERIERLERELDEANETIEELREQVKQSSSNSWLCNELELKNDYSVGELIALRDILRQFS